MRKHDEKGVLVERKCINIAKEAIYVNQDEFHTNTRYIQLLTVIITAQSKRERKFKVKNQIVLDL